MSWRILRKERPISYYLKCVKDNHAICYESRNIKEHEKNYETHDLDLSAIVHALNIWMHYFMGRKFELKTNHCGLKYLLEKPSLLQCKLDVWIFLL